MDKRMEDLMVDIAEYLQQDQEMYGSLPFPASELKGSESEAANKGLSKSSLESKEPEKSKSAPAGKGISESKLEDPEAEIIETAPVSEGESKSVAKKSEIIKTTPASKSLTESKPAGMVPGKSDPASVNEGKTESKPGDKTPEKFESTSATEVESESKPVASKSEKIASTIVSEGTTESKPAYSGNEKSESESARKSTSISTQEESKPVFLENRLEQATTLEELMRICEESGELKTDLEGTNLVFGVGNPHADLMLIGEAPGEQEDKQGEPFVGAAGQLLNKILAAIQFERDDVYIANILKHRPPGNRNPNPDERLRSLPYLLKQIDLIQPKLILCLGRVSATTLLKKEDSLRNLRGQFYPYRNSLLTVTYHPAALLRNPQWKRPTWEDVQKLRAKYDELKSHD